MISALYSRTPGGMPPSGIQELPSMFLDFRKIFPPGSTQLRRSSPLPPALELSLHCSTALCNQCYSSSTKLHHRQCRRRSNKASAFSKRRLLLPRRRLQPSPLLSRASSPRSLPPLQGTPMQTQSSHQPLLWQHLANPIPLVQQRPLSAL